MIKAVIFDCFGVILRDALLAMIEEIEESKQEKIKQIDKILHQSGRGIIDIHEADKKISKQLGLSTQEYTRRKYGGEERNQQLLDYITTLRKKYKTAMLSNVSNGGLLRRFHVDELDKYFDVAIASGEIGYAKPEPQAYEIAADELGVRLDECVFTDDREEYCDGARAVGMQAIQYVSFDQFKLDLSKALKN